VHWIENVEYPPDLIAAMSFMCELRYEHPLFTSQKSCLCSGKHTISLRMTRMQIALHNNMIRCLQPTALKECEDEDGQEEVDDGEPRLS
jgi:hypothetical protein